MFNFWWFFSFSNSGILSKSFLAYLYINSYSYSEFFLFILVVVSYQYKTFHCFFSSGAAAGVAFLSAPFYFFCCWFYYYWPWSLPLAFCCSLGAEDCCSFAFLAAAAALKSNPKLGCVTSLQKMTLPKTLAQGAIFKIRLVYRDKF